jgi:hypothetical protein
MSPQKKEKLFRLALLPLTAAVLLATGCTSSTTTTASQSSAQTGSAFVVGTDAPLASVVSFPVVIQSVTLTSSGGSSADLVTGTPTVDFARFNGLQTLVDMNDVADGTYTGVTITLGTATLSYLNTSGTGAPTITTLSSTTTPALTLTSPTVTASFATPLVIQHGSQPVGLRMDFDLAKSITVSGGNITGSVTPTIDVSTVARQDLGGYIDELVGGVSTAPTGTSEPASFMIQGPHGEQFTINTNSSTTWDGSASLGALNTNSIVQVSGTLDAADQTMDADEVAIVSDKNFYARGQVTYVTPTSGPATSFDLYVRALEPTGVPISLGQIAQVNLTGSENYYVYSMHNPLTGFLFNSSALVAGQHVAIGGPDSGVVSPTNVTVDRIHLENWGFNGTIVAGSENSSQGTFKMNVTGFAGVLVPETITVYLGGHSDFRYGLGAFTDLTDGSSVRVVGLLLKNPSNGNVILWARHVDGLNFTDFNTFAF